ncbi:MAG: energy transducer TonB [Altererythrobacter sp.]|nr:energy transducer TonB [Altererythrobacter sp.]
METRALRQDEKWGLGVAVGLHLALAAMLLFQPGPGEPFEIPERMTVSLATDVSLSSAAPEIAPDSRAAMAPTVSDEVQAPVEQSDGEVSREPTREPPRTNTSRTAITQQPRQATQTPPRQATGTEIGENFLEGAGSDRASDSTLVPASEIGRSATASLIQSLSRQIKPHWNAPSGVDTELLVTELAFDLNPDGTLRSRPRVLRQSGINASNRPQAGLHAERAIRAVQLAAPFDLPAEYYNAWKSIRGARFDRNLSR